MKYIYEFNKAIADLLDSPLVQSMDKLEQHSKSATLLDHLVYTSYISYIVCKRLGLNENAAARGALLHDFRIKDIKSFIYSIFTHSKLALKEANTHFHLTELEQDIIKKHMWPATPFLFPKYKESFIVSLVDKYCATMEFLGLYKKTKTTRKLSNLVQATRGINIINIKKRMTPSVEKKKVAV
ncbi:hypothetical protein [Geosporobacter ferrireducens]|uniref:HD domain-containing protein n=1 Tax=Geosporobacter ferrireducens TaxID=1424294 RepID=A0A1D8GPQ0_9FIRM|nr:hypothetical protein [Geosporobacter ferrireducens]AOT72885.1 hypothetical protein Gferi_27010 [Geosporobacter ferrireducens]